MKREFNISVILSAVDRMSTVVKGAVKNSQTSLRAFSQNQEVFGRRMQSVGMNAVAVGAATAAALKQPIDAFMEQEKASERLASSMLQDGNRMNEYYKQVNDLAIELGNKLPGTSADLQNMMTVLVRNGVKPEQILGGMGAATANLAAVLEKSYDETAVFSSKLGKAAGIASEDMMQFLDVIARTANLGVQTDEMQYAFSRSSSALKNMGLTGLQASKSVAALYANLIQMGASGETVGTGMTSLFNAAVNPEKMAKFNAELAKFGVAPMKFTDAKGNFLGIEKMISQLDRIKQKGLGAEQMTSIATALLGPGQDANFLGQIISNGTEGYNQMVKNMAGQATLLDKVNRLLDTFGSKWEAATGTFTNMMAKFGEAMKPALKDIAAFVSNVSEKLMVLMDKYPGLTAAIGKGIMYFAAFTLAIGGVSLAVGSVARVIGMYANAFRMIGSWFGPGGWINTAFTVGRQIFMYLGQAIMWVGRAFMMAGRFMMANPIILIITAIAVAAYLIYKYWDDIVPFFQKLWRSVTTYLTNTWNTVVTVLAEVWRRIKNLIRFGLQTIWDLFTTYHPLGIVIKHWDEIWAFMKTLPAKFMQAGENIMNSLFEGMKNMANKPIEAMKETVAKMREYLPFSPAKVGPLKDIHRVKIVETIAEAVKPQPLVKAMRTVAVAGLAAASPIMAPNVAAKPVTRTATSAANQAAGQGGSNAVVINYNPTLNFDGGGQAGNQNVLEELRKHPREIAKLVQQVMAREKAKSF